MNVKKYKIYAKNIFGVFLFLFILGPSIVYAQHYIIENIPDTGDDGLRPKIETPVVSGGSQIIEDVTTKVTTNTTKTTETIITETVVENKTTFQFFGLVGTVAGTVLALATTTVPLFVTTPTMIQDLMLLNFFGLFASRKNERRWGVIFDTDTKRPIPATKITLFDNKGKELETTYSNKEGRFGFLAGEGIYKIDVYKKDYELYSEEEHDVVYGDMYDGGELNVSGEDVLSISVAMRSQTIDWKVYADKKVTEYTSTWSLVKKYLFTTAYFIGFIATIVITIFYPSIFNIVLVVISSLFFVIIYFFKKKDHGTVTTSDKKPVPFAVVNLYTENGKKDAFAVTDVIGRYYMLADNGQYIMKASGQSVGGKKQDVQNNVYVRDGLVDKNVMFK